MVFPATVDVSINPPDQTQSETLSLRNVDYHEHSLTRLSDATYCLRRLERRLALLSLAIAVLAFGPLRMKMQGLVFLEQKRRHVQWNTAYSVLPPSVRIPNEELIGL